MSFYRAPFRTFVTNQLNTRARLLLKKDRDNSWYDQYLSKTAFLRVAPLVNITDETIIGNNTPPTEFSKNFVLEGAPLIYNNNKFSKGPQFPTHLSSNGNKNSLLNNPNLRTSPNKDGFGIVPPPGVTSLKVKTKSFYGNLREATVNIKCFNISQFDIIEKIYARPGHHVLIEWGWSHFLDYNKDSNKFKKTQTTSLISDPSNKVFWGNKVDAGKVYRQIDEKKVNYKGCYDGFLGIIKNFDSTMDSDGGFTLKIQLIGRGDIVDSIFLNRSGEVKDTVSPSRLFSMRNHPTTYIRKGGVTTVYSADEEQENPHPQGTSDWIKYEYEQSIKVDQEVQDYRDKEAEFQEKSRVTSNNLINYLLYAAQSTLLNSVYGEDDNINPLEGFTDDKFLKIKKNIDTFTLGDPDKDLTEEQLKNYKLDWKSAKNIKGTEVGLGAYIRLGHFVKVLNNLAIPSDGKGNPLITINNLLYVKDFDPSKNKQSPSIYPSCYSAFITDSSSPNNMLGKLDRIWSNSPSKFKREVGWNLWDYANENQMYTLNVGDAKSKSSSSAIVIPPILKGTKYGDMSHTNYHDPNTSTSALDSAAVGQLRASSKIIRYILGSLTHLGSSQPSKILFPHQFLTGQDPTPGRNSTNHAYTDSEFERWREGDYFNLRIAVNESSKSSFSDMKGNHKVFDLYTNPYNEDHTVTEGEVSQVKEGSEGSKKMKENKAAPDAFISDSAPASMALHAITDGCQQLLLGNKLTEKYWEHLDNSFSTALGWGTRRIRDRWGNVKDITAPKKGLKELMGKLQDRSNNLFNPAYVIDNIYLNVWWLLGIVEEDTNISLDELLEKICGQINTSSGGATDIRVTTNPVFGDIISMIDFNFNSAASRKTAKKMFKFPKTGRTSLFKKIDLTGKIPSAQASSIAIAAQGPKNEGNILSVTYKCFIEDVQDRISAESTQPSTSTLTQIKTDKYISYRTRFISFMKDALSVIKLYKTINVHSPHKEKEWFNGMEEASITSLNNMTRILPYLVSNQPVGEGYTKEEWDHLSKEDQDKLRKRFTADTLNYLIKNTKKGVNVRNVVSIKDQSLPITSVIPLEIKLSMEGISGILASNVFKLNKGILPDRYNQDRVSYMVKQESQVLKGMQWETSITGLMVLDDVEDNYSTDGPLTEEGIEITDSSGETETIVLDPADAGSRFEVDDTPVTSLGGNQARFYTPDNRTVESGKIKYIMLHSTGGRNTGTGRAQKTIDRFAGGDDNLSPTGAVYWKDKYGGIDGLFKGEVVKESDGTIKGYKLMVEASKASEIDSNGKGPIITKLEKLAISYTTKSSKPGLVARKKWKWENTGLTVEEVTPASIHYTVDKEGVVVQGVLEKDQAWHAGKAQTKERSHTSPKDTTWEELSKIGKQAGQGNSIGIETNGKPHVGLGKGTAGPGYAEMYTEELVNSLANLCAKLCKKYDIPMSKEGIVGHVWRRPRSRKDPGYKQNSFDFDDFYARVKKASGTVNVTTPKKPKKKLEKTKDKYKNKQSEVSKKKEDASYTFQWYVKTYENGAKMYTPNNDARSEIIHHGRTGFWLTAGTYDKAFGHWRNKLPEIDDDHKGYKHVTTPYQE